MGDSSTENTILESYRNSMNAQYQQDQLAQQKEIADENLEMRRQELDETRDYHQSALDYAHAKAKMDIQDALNEHYGNTASTPTQYLPQPDPQTSFIPGQNPGGAPGFGVSDPSASANLSQPYQMKFDPHDVLYKVFGDQGATIDPMSQAKQFLLQKRLADLKAYEAGSTESQKDAAKEPYEVAADKRKYASAANVADIAGRYRVKAREAGVLDDPSQDPDVINAGLDTVLHGGALGTNYTPKAKMNIMSAANQQGLSTHYDDKQISKLLGNAQGVDAALNDGDEFARTYSRDAEKGGPAAIAKGYAHVGDMYGAQTALKDKQGQVITTLEQSARKQEVDVLRQLMGNGGNPMLTTQENLANNMKARVLFSRIINGNLHGLSPDQKKIVMHDNNLDDYAEGGKYSGKTIVTSPDGKESMTFDNTDPRLKKVIAAGGKVQ